MWVRISTYDVSGENNCLYNNLRCFTFVWVFVDINYPLSTDLGVTCHSSVGKASACNAGDPGLIPEWERFPGEGICYPLQYSWTSLVGQMVKNLPALRRPGFDPWAGKMPWRRVWQPIPGFLPGEFPWTEEPGRLQSMGLQRVRHD